MQELVADCPRCGANAHTFVVKDMISTHIEYRWQRHFEAFCICKNCLRSTIFYLSQKDSNSEDVCRYPQKLSEYKHSFNNILNVEGYVSLRNMASRPAPEHTPEEIEKVYKEGAESALGNCPNAAVAMFRLCIDLATKSLLPNEDIDGINNQVRGKLKPRLKWLFDTRRLQNGLESLSECIREDGNDGAHDGTITFEEAEDIMEFCTLLLERLYTEPTKLEIANQRRIARREVS